MAKNNVMDPERLENFPVVVPRVDIHLSTCEGGGGTLDKTPEVTPMWLELSLIRAPCFVESPSWLCDGVANLYK